MIFLHPVALFRAVAVVLGDGGDSGLRGGAVSKAAFSLAFPRALTSMESEDGPFDWPFP